jgi:hypothetical protein
LVPCGFSAGAAAPGFFWLPLMDDHLNDRPDVGT